VGWILLAGAEGSGRLMAVNDFSGDRPPGSVCPVYFPIEEGSMCGAVLADLIPALEGLVAFLPQGFAEGFSKELIVADDDHVAIQHHDIARDAVEKDIVFSPTNTIFGDIVGYFEYVWNLPVAIHNRFEVNDVIGEDSLFVKAVFFADPSFAIGKGESSHAGRAFPVGSSVDLIAMPVFPFPVSLSEIVVGLDDAEFAIQDGDVIRRALE